MALYQLPTTFTGSYYVEGESALEHLIQKLGAELKILAKEGGHPTGRGSINIARDRIEVEYESGTRCVVRGCFTTDPQKFVLSARITVIGNTLLSHESALNLSCDLSFAAGIMAATEGFLVAKNGFEKV